MSEAAATGAGLSRPAFRPNRKITNSAGLSGATPTRHDRAMPLSMSFCVIVVTVALDEERLVRRRALEGAHAPNCVSRNAPMLRRRFDQRGSALGSKTAHWLPVVDASARRKMSSAADRHVLPLRLRRRRQGLSRSDSDRPRPRHTQRVDAERGEAVTVASGQRVGEFRRAAKHRTRGDMPHGIAGEHSGDEPAGGRRRVRGQPRDGGCASVPAPAGAQLLDPLPNPLTSVPAQCSSTRRSSPPDLAVGAIST